MSILIKIKSTIRFVISKIKNAIVVIKIFVSSKYDQIINTIVAITAIVVIIFLIWELKEIRKQNELTEITMRQTYRPTGVINELGGSDTTRFFIRFDYKNIENNYYSQEELNNKGNGILFMIGVITFKNQEFIDFYSKSLVQIIKELNIEIGFDHMPEEERMKPLLANKSAGIKIRWYNVNLSQPDYSDYLYGIILYKDQSSNLYSTIIKYKRCRLINIIKADEEFEYERSWNEYYQSYKKEKQNELADYIKQFHPSLANFIRKNVL